MEATSRAGPACRINCGRLLRQRAGPAAICISMRRRLAAGSRNKNCTIAAAAASSQRRGRPTANPIFSKSPSSSAAAAAGCSARVARTQSADCDSRQQIVVLGGCGSGLKEPLGLDALENKRPLARLASALERGRGSCNLQLATSKPLSSRAHFSISHRARARAHFARQRTAGLKRRPPAASLGRRRCQSLATYLSDWSSAQRPPLARGARL